MTDEFSTALHQRGVDPDIAELVARVGIHVFRTAYRQWLEADDNTDRATMTETVMSLLATIVPASASTTPLRTVQRNTADPEYGGCPVKPSVFGCASLHPGVRNRFQGAFRWLPASWRNEMHDLPEALQVQVR